MISYILPFYHKAALFRMTYPLNTAFRHTDAEVICVLDEPSEEQEMIRFARAHTETKFRIIVNDYDHDWRPPSRAYNVGILHAAGTHCALFDPESVLQLPDPAYLHALTNQDFRRSRAGIGWHIPEIEPNESLEMLRRRILAVEAVYAPAAWGFGFLLAHRHELVLLCGMDESRTDYGGDDDEIRHRLTRIGVVTEIDPMIKTFHIMHPNPYDRIDQHSPLKPHIVLNEQKETWGRAYSRIPYDWRAQ